MSPPPGCITVLHVDDDPAFLDLAEHALERTTVPIRVVGATTAADGLAHLDDDGSSVDCVVSDYEMPEMDGLEFLVAVRGEFPDLPFVLLTGRGSEEIASRAISAGVTDYLQKEPGLGPFTLLANRLGIYVERARDRSRLEAVERELAFWKRYSPAVVVLDRTGHITSASASCRDLFGVEALEDLLDRPMAALVHHDEREELEAVIDRVLGGEAPVTCRDRTLVRVGGEVTSTTVQWRTVDHWGEEAMLAVMNDVPPLSADAAPSG